VLGQRAVALALHAVLSIPMRLTVADQN